MKKPKPLLTKTVIGTVTASMAIASCQKQEYNLEDSIYGSLAENGTRGIAMIDIENTNLSDEFIEKLRILSDIVNNVLTDRKEAKRFSENPDQYFIDKEIDFKIGLSQEEKNTLMAFADAEILEAIKANDFDSFLSIGKEKGYLGIIKEGSIEDLRAIFKSEEDYRAFVDSIPEGAVVPMGFFGVAIAAVYVAVESIAGIQLGVYFHVALWQSSSSDETRSITQSLDQREPALKIWMDNNGTIDTKTFYYEMIDKQVNSLTDIFMKHYPEMNEDTFRSILRNNLEGYYGLRK